VALRSVADHRHDHDLLLTVGFFCVTQIEFTRPRSAAFSHRRLLAERDVVVLDRIREVMRKYKRLSTSEIIDMSINAVLPRTIMKATTVFLALLGCSSLAPRHPIVLAAMIWGIFVATYSSISSARRCIIYMGRARRHLRQMREKENAGADVKDVKAKRGVARPRRGRIRARSHSIAAYGKGVFAFARHGRTRGDPGDAKGVRPIDATSIIDLDPAALAPLIAESAENPGSIEFVIVGTASICADPKASRAALGQAGLRFEAMATGAALRVYNVMQSEGRRVAAALIAAP